MRNAKLLWFLIVVLALGIAGCATKEEAPPAREAVEAQPPPTPIDPATVGSITGKVSFDGSKPKARVIRMDA